MIKLTTSKKKTTLKVGCKLETFNGFSYSKQIFKKGDKVAIYDTKLIIDGYNIALTDYNEKRLNGFLE